jgi:hypothetical protein
VAARSDTAPLAPAHVADLLAAALETIRAEVAALPPAVLRWHPRDGEWCIQEVIGHLIEAEQRGFAGRIRILLREREPRLQTWDQQAVARDRRDCDREIGALLAELTALRQPAIALARGLGAADLERGGHHPNVGYLRVADLLHEWVHHDRNHVKQMLANVQDYAWPAMGNAQRFSAP